MRSPVWLKLPALGAGVIVVSSLLGAGCQNEPPKVTAPAAEAPRPAEAPKLAEAAKPAADAGPPKPKMVANPDGLSLAERMQKRQAAESKLAAELATAEKDRLLKYDRTKLPMHKKVYAFIKKTRAQYDGIEKKAGDKEKSKAALEKLQGSLQKTIAATAKEMAKIDPKGGNSNVTTDYDVMLNALANDYPTAIAASFDGDKGPLAEQKAELDKRSKKIEDWLCELGKKKK